MKNMHEWKALITTNFVKEVRLYDREHGAIF
jgi:hypothetical protein